MALNHLGTAAGVESATTYGGFGDASHRATISMLFACIERGDSTGPTNHQPSTTVREFSGTDPKEPKGHEAMKG